MDTSVESMSQVDFDGFVFRKSLMLQLELQEVLSALGRLDDLVCLEVGGNNALFSYQLRRHGGHWKTLALDAATAARLKDSLESDVDVLPSEGGFAEKHTYDVAVIAGGELDAMLGDHDFVKRCHHVLKPDGRLIVCVERKKRISLMNLIKPLLTGTHQSAFTESRLFETLKNGFDVSSVRTYMRFFSTWVDDTVRHMAKRRQQEPLEDQRRFYNVAGVFYWIAFQIDALLFLTRGHRMIAVARRRGWRSREAPILSDGRKISEAVLSSLD